MLLRSLPAFFFVLLLAPTLSSQQGTAPPDTATPPSSESQSGVSPVKPRTKAEEKEFRQRQKEEEKKRKEDQKEKSFLKMQGGEIVAPTLDADGNAVTLSPCSKKDKECQKKRKQLLHRKKVGMKIQNGTLTVDGWTGKARLNYDITEIKFLYFYVPEVGTAIVSTERFPNSVEEKGGFNGKTLTVTTPDGHTIELTGEEPLVNKKSQSVWVGIDKDFVFPARYPAFGYGSTARAPYNWPGARPMSEEEKKLASKAPPLPKGLEAKQMVLPCQKVKPGERPVPVKINGMMMTPPVCPPAPASAVAPATPPVAQPR
jgi:hypothetical protein